ncbi:Hypothetical protein CAP_5844 [Chondromyces apiculatus DSM 436]|uniref:Uncharacterized protein n=1 Tax=Chondromyces apiculatus DSM 436 TaxID=1192034 RepID=A0A017TFU6_9BACT|nr:Hypothetical protein CAP_5844 [Chondromyces apiculatus DSM 436]
MGLVACEDGGEDGAGGAGGGAGGGTPAACFDYGSWDGSAPAVSLRTDVVPILQGSCTFGTSCHGVPGAAGSVYLGPSAATTPTDEQLAAMLADTVGVEPRVEAGMPRISAGDPSQSFLMHKVDGTLSCGDLACAATESCQDAMPLNQEPLSAEKRDILRRWIAQGAQDN